jgi:hypothetical protein
MEITWQIWQKVLLGVSITGSAAIVCILLAYCFIKHKRFKCSKKDLQEVVVIQDKNEVTDKDQNGNFTNKITENTYTTEISDDQKTNCSLTSSTFSSIGRTFHKDWYHSCPDFGRSTITHSENGYIIIAQSRPVVVDGNNVSFVYGNGSFSARGLHIVYKYFSSRGWTNKEIAIFVKVPFDISTIDINICKDLEIMGVLHWTQSTKKSRPVSVTSEEDYKILEYAKKKGGIIITKNSFHDWYDCFPEFREVITKQLLKYSFVNGNILFHTAPIRKNGKTLEEFLTF